jgi:homoserine kinase
MPQQSQITIRAPATAANLGPGYDVFGLALEHPNDTITLTRTDPLGIRIQIFGFSAESISTLPERNTAGVVAKLLIKEFSLKTGLNIKIEKGIWIAKGLGSSAAPAAAVAYGLNKMFNLNLTNQELVRFAAKGEIASAGSEHADNVSAAVCGNFVIIKSYNPVEIIELQAPKDMEVCVAFPHMRTPAGKTARARAVVPQMIPLEKHIHNIGKAAAMVSGFATGDADLIGKSMVDLIVEPARAHLIPGYAQVKENALLSGASGVTISGAGPSVIAVLDKKKADAKKIALAMREGFKTAGYEATAIATRPGKGTQIVEK